MTISHIELIQKINEESKENAQELANILEAISLSKVLNDEIKNIGNRPFSYLQQQTVVKVEENIIATLGLKCKFSSLRTKICRDDLRELYDGYVSQFWKKLKEDIEEQRKTIYHATLESAKKNLEEIHRQPEMGEIHNALSELIEYVAS